MIKLKFLAKGFVIAAMSLGTQQAAANNDIGVSICTSVANNDVKSLKKTVKLSGMKLRKFYGDLRCNNLTLLQFSLQKNAEDVGLYLIKKVSKSVLKKAQEVEYVDANGFADSSVGAALKKKVG